MAPVDNASGGDELNSSNQHSTGQDSTAQQSAGQDSFHQQIAGQDSPHQGYGPQVEQVLRSWYSLSASDDIAAELAQKTGPAQVGANEIHCSCSYLFRIKVAGKYFLVSNEESRNLKYQPVGGAYHFSPSMIPLAQRIFGMHGAYSSHDDQATLSDFALDYRFFISLEHLPDFWSWWQQDESLGATDATYLQVSALPISIGQVLRDAIPLVYDLSQRYGQRHQRYHQLWTQSISPDKGKVDLPTYRARETVFDLSREFSEEMLDSGIIPRDEVELFKTLTYDYCGRTFSLCYDQRFDCPNLMLTDVVEVVLTNEQERCLERLVKQDSAKYYLATAEEMLAAYAPWQDGPYIIPPCLRVPNSAFALPGSSKAVRKEERFNPSWLKQVIKRWREEPALTKLDTWFYPDRKEAVPGPGLSADAAKVAVAATVADAAICANSATVAKSDQDASPAVAPSMAPAAVPAAVSATEEVASAAVFAAVFAAAPAAEEVAASFTAPVRISEHSSFLLAPLFMPQSVLRGSVERAKAAGDDKEPGQVNSLRISCQCRLAPERLAHEYEKEAKLQKYLQTHD